MKYAKESLNEYTDYKFFEPLFEAEEMYEESEDEMTPEEKKKLAIQMERDGKQVIKKCYSNWKTFLSEAGDKWQEFKDFWETQKAADETIGQKGKFYNLHMSDYIVGVVKNAKGVAELRVYNTSHKEDNLGVFICKNPGVVKEFIVFLNEIKQKMKDIIAAQKEAMEAKKAADKIKAKEEKLGAKRAKVDAFLSEQFTKDRIDPEWAAADRSLDSVPVEPMSDLKSKNEYDEEEEFKNKIAKVRTLKPGHYAGQYPEGDAR